MICCPRNGVISMANGKADKKPRYSLWKSTGYMIGLAWRYHKSVLWLVIAAALVAAGQNIAEMLIAPAVLNKLEVGAPLSELLLTIGLFTGVLFLLMGLSAYLHENVSWGRIYIRRKIVGAVNLKRNTTSYPNTLNADFQNAYQECSNATAGNSQATEAVWNTLTDLLTNLIGFIVYLCMLSDLNLFVAGLVVITAAAGYAAGKRINSWGYRHRSEEETYRKKLSYLGKAAIDREYAKDLRIFGLSGWINELWQDTMRLYRAFLHKRESVYIWTNVIDLLLTFLRNGIAYAYLIWLTVNRGLSASQFLLYFATISGFSQWVTGILNRFSVLHKQCLEISTVLEFLHWPEPFLFGQGKAISKAADDKYELELRDVSFRYPGAAQDTLSHINLTLHRGEKLAIVGLNGAGKTTLVKLLCGFLDPTSGSVLLNGQDIRQYNRDDYYSLFSAVFQDFSVIADSAAVNVAQRIDGIDIPRVWKCLEQAGLKEKIASLPKGSDTPIGRSVFEDGVELSGGQLQRLMLARALYKDAPILVLDEPTAALDPIAERDIYEKYNDMTAGKSSLFISHRLASTRFCSRIIYLANGCIAEEGTHASLLKKNERYAELFRVQSKYYQEGEQEHDE
jgi:ATP-binding cassette, subfamily B, bacterial